MSVLVTSKKAKMRKNFNFHDVCKKHNLDPQKTSFNKAKCLFYGIPVTSSKHQIECAENGLPIVGTSQHDVEQEKKRRGRS